MNETLVHRGPDSGRAFVNGRVGLAARRLASIDLAGGDQPIANEDGSITVVQNGEIYYYRELRAELERAGGHRFSTQSDTEVLVHLYEEHGPDFVRRLRGMFAIALWDRAQPPARRRPRSLRDQAALLPASGRLRVVRIGAEGAASHTRLLARGRLGRTRRVPRLRLRSGPAHDLSRSTQASARQRALAPLSPGRKRRRLCSFCAPISKRPLQARDRPFS
jgi:hypothetical protein